MDTEVFVSELVNRLGRGEAVQTPFGQFFVARIGVWDTAMRPGHRRILQYVASDRFLERVVPDEHLPETRRRAELESDLAIRIPKPTDQVTPVHCVARAVEELKGSGQACMGGLGTFAVRPWIDEAGDDGEHRQITFQPGPALRAQLGA